MCTQRRTRKHNWECVQRVRRLSDNIISVSLSVCIMSPFFSLLPLSPSPHAFFLSVSLDGNRGGAGWKSIRGEHTSYIPSVMSPKQINVPGVEICAATR